MSTILDEGGRRSGNDLLFLERRSILSISKRKQQFGMSPVGPYEQSLRLSSSIWRYWNPPQILNGLVEERVHPIPIHAMC